MCCKSPKTAWNRNTRWGICPGLQFLLIFPQTRRNNKRQRIIRDNHARYPKNYQNYNSSRSRRPPSSSLTLNKTNNIWCLRCLTPGCPTNRTFRTKTGLQHCIRWRMLVVCLRCLVTRMRDRTSLFSVSWLRGRRRVVWHCFGKRLMIRIIRRRSGHTSRYPVTYSAHTIWSAISRKEDPKT